MTKMNNDIILVGDGGHAKIIVDILEASSNYNIIGVTSINKNNNEFLGYPILGNDSILHEYFNKGINKVALGLGGYRNNNLRIKMYKLVKKIGFEVVSAVHPHAIISKSVKLGEGNAIFAGAIINPEVRIGNNVIIATGASIDHETVIKDHALISAGVTIGGYVEIEEGVICALGSNVISGIKIGKNALIAAGAVVVNDIMKNAKVFGIPAIPVQ
jgi:sugar O-acyltransferase (sialic acid O-acetyltransferase NeuD family)